MLGDVPTCTYLVETRMCASRFTDTRQLHSSRARRAFSSFTGTSQLPADPFYKNGERNPSSNASELRTTYHIDDKTLKMTLHYVYLKSLCLLLALSVAVVVDAVDDHAKAQVEWLKSKGGFFHDKIEFDPPKGLFATADLAKGEMLIIIPRECLLTSASVCDAVKTVMAEHKLGDKSEFAPYIDYLYSTQQGLLPSAWSDAGKDLITNIWGKDLLPYSVGLTSLSFEDECDGSGDPVEEHTYMMVYSRCWDEICVPVYDMINHRNGYWNNVDSNSVHRGRNGLFVFASRDIEAGEQLHFSYNWCSDCGHLGNNDVAPHIFRDYGFVEQYPRRWVMYANRGKLLFDLDQEKDQKELKLTWLSKEPDSAQIDHLKRHLKRLQGIREDVSRKAEHLDSKHERETSMEFYQALTEALEYAIAAGTEKASVQDEL